MGMTALDVAVGCGRADVAQQLIRAFGGQALMNESASRPFLLALEAGCGKSLLLLLEESGGVGEVEVKSALHRIRAVRNSSNMLAFIKALVERGADLNSLGRFDTPSGTIMTTPLCRAVILNMVNYVTVLVKAGANVNQVDGEGNTALHYSVMGGLVMMTCLLVDRGAKVGTRQASAVGDTPLHIAVNNAELLQMSFMMMQDITALAKTNLKGHQPFQLGASFLQESSIFEQALESISSREHILVESRKFGKAVFPSKSLYYEKEAADEDLFNVNQIVFDLQKKRSKFPRLEEALEFFYNFDKENEFSIDDLVTRAIVLIENAETSKDAFCKAVDHHSRDASTTVHILKLFLSVSIIMNNLEAVQYIIFKGKLNMNEGVNNEPFFIHIQGRTNSVEILAEIIEHGADINFKDSQGKSVLYRAVHDGLLENVEFLLSAGADQTIVATIDGITLIHKAAIKGHHCILDVLLEKSSAQLNSLSKIGSSPFHFAAMSGSTETMSCILKYGANADQRDHLNNSALHYAAMGENGAGAVEYLLERGFQHSEANDRGDSPLHIAATCGDGSIIRALVHAGADINERSQELFTPLYLACRSKKKAAVEVLIKCDAEVNALSTYNSETALHVCAKKDLPEEALLLINASAELQALDGRGFSPLEVAAENDSTKVGRILLERLKDFPGAMNRRVTWHGIKDSSHRHFLDLAAGSGDYVPRENTFLHSLCVDERPLGGEAGGRKTRLHPVLDLVREENRARAEAVLDKMEE